MKLIVLTFLFILMLGLSGNAQGLKGIINNATKKDSSGKVTAGSVFNSSKTALSNEEIISGLKEALQVGAQRSTSKLSSVDGFFKDAALKILMPAEAQKVERTLRGLGMNKQVDNAILSMNRAAEDAAKDAVPIFINAIKGMSFQDALAILKGGDNAATNYLKGKTTISLSDAFRPVIENSLKKVNATKYWDAVFTSYNKFSNEKVNTDLVQYVTEKALAGIFLQLGNEEQKIRKDPGARTSEILRKVFSY
jgi:hypothetical protein